jgi:hypothetical protein
MRSSANGRDALRRVRSRREVISGAGGALLATPMNNPRPDFSEETLDSIPRFAVGDSRASHLSDVAFLAG